jgi:plastocyanin
MFDGTTIAALLLKNYQEEMTAVLEAQVESTKATVIKIKTIKNEMKYDLTEFVVKAGSKVEIVFENNDFMQHNLLVLEQGSTIRVGAAADKLAQNPQGAEKAYVPDIPEVLHATAMVNPNEIAVLKFTAPTKPGDYPYICTFPGHWQIMQGIMKVEAP